MIPRKIQRVLLRVYVGFLVASTLGLIYMFATRPTTPVGVLAIDGLRINMSVKDFREKYPDAVCPEPMFNAHYATLPHWGGEIMAMSNWGGLFEAARLTSVRWTLPTKSVEADVFLSYVSMPQGLAWHRGMSKHDPLDHVFVAPHLGTGHALILRQSKDTGRITLDLGLCDATAARCWMNLETRYGKEAFSFEDVLRELEPRSRRFMGE
jgi:hypothetical protein